MPNGIDPKSLSNEALSEKVLELRAVEKEATLSLLFHLLEVERRALHVKEGYASMFDYCRRKLLYSESGASRRIRTARALGSYPVLGEYLQSGAVNLSTVSIVASILTFENQAQVFRDILGKSQNEVEAYVSKYRPVAQPREKIKAIGVAQKVEPLEMSLSFPHNRSGCTPEGDAQPSEPPREERFELRFSISKEVMSLVQEAKTLLSSKHPRGVSLEVLFEELLTRFVSMRSPKEREKRRALRNTKNPTTAAVAHTRSIPQRVRDAVYVRDDGKCTYRAPNGTRCGSRWDLEIDHILPRALGGENTIDNLHLVCRTHNLHAAVQTFGRAFMERKMLG